jgi:hypothetical protein
MEELCPHLIIRRNSYIKKIKNNFLVQGVLKEFSASESYIMFWPYYSESISISCYSPFKERLDKYISCYLSSFEDFYL